MMGKWVLMIMIVLVPAIAAADCAEGIRPAKPQEKAFYEKISSELHRLIPPAPEGCRLSNARTPGTIHGMSGDEKIDEFSINAMQMYFCVIKSTGPVPKRSHEAQKI